MIEILLAKGFIGATIRRASIALVVVAAAGLAPLRAEAADVKGSRDHPLISRYAGSEIIGYDTRAFDELALLEGIKIIIKNSYEDAYLAEGDILGVLVERLRPIAISLR